MTARETGRDPDGRISAPILDLEPNLAAPDDVYEMLVDAHEGLTPDESRLLDAKLILVLANHIGDAAILAQAVALARKGLGPDRPASAPQP